MEIFFELLIIVGLSVLVSFILAELLSMASACHVVEEDVVMTSCKDEIQRKHDKNSVLRDFESERKVRCFEDSIKVNACEAEEFMIEKIENRGSELSVMSYNSVIRDNKEVSRVIEVVLLENKSTEVKYGKLDSEELKEENVSVVGDDVEENVAGESSKTVTIREIAIESENMVEESLQSSNFHDIEIDLIKDNGGSHSHGASCYADDDNDDEEEGLFDDWEGIERSELEKRFGTAVVFVGSKSNAARVLGLGSDVNLRLYGLHKIAIEGPCLMPQPMALQVSARAKWHAWQRLENMSRDVAMEQYIALLSRSIPGWMGDDLNNLVFKVRESQKN
ncbi:unnamed protein product [Ilex paraguariensis]|uniref:ACB domain-containing protein n=1 Tax=Ilex paraguariensis TaxID=185542 RepID=A0ABC8UZB6_9AQUA